MLFSYHDITVRFANNNSKLCQTFNFLKNGLLMDLGGPIEFYNKNGFLYFLFSPLHTVCKSFQKAQILTLSKVYSAKK